jgi:hypothetical protein
MSDRQLYSWTLSSVLSACRVESYPGKKSNSELQKDEGVPSISGVVPRRISLLGGAEITLRGSAFYPTTEVYIGDKKCNNTIYVSFSEIRCVAPSFEGNHMWQRLKVVNRNATVGYFYDFSYVSPAEAIELEENSDSNQEWSWDSLASVQKLLSKFQKKKISLTPENRSRWRKEALRRNRQRQLDIGLNRDGDDDWSRRESIMNDSITLRYLESINRLETRYPHAVPNAYILFSKLYLAVESYPVDQRGALGELKKAAAIRFLERTWQDDSPADPNRSQLSQFQVLALAWAAVTDTKLYISTIDQQDRIWGLLESLAIIQRAHNDLGEGISFDDSQEPDSPSCAMGTYKRFLEHLDGVHPDVRISVETDVNSGAALSNAAIIEEIRNQHTSLFHQYSSQDRQLIRSGIESTNTHFSQYVDRLRAAVVNRFPNIPRPQLEELTGSLTMEALLDAEE